MKKYFFFILLLLNCDSIYAQSTKYVPQILVLGTVHSGNKKITHNSLYNALAKFQPDVILWEDEEDFKYVFGLFTAYRLKIAKPPMEQLALQKYKRHHKMVPMLGFDTIIKPRKTFIKNLITTYDAFHEAMGQLKMNLSDSLQYATFIKLQDAYYNQFMFSPLSFINQDSVFRKSMTIKKMENEIASIAGNYNMDSTILAAYTFQNRFWDTRNQYMVNKIIEIAKQRIPQKIAIITGLSHKYYLVDMLSLTSEFPVQLVSFNE
jgi:hypothetical protein